MRAVPSCTAWPYHLGAGRVRKGTGRVHAVPTHRNHTGRVRDDTGRVTRVASDVMRVAWMVLRGKVGD